MTVIATRARALSVIVPPSRNTEGLNRTLASLEDCNKDIEAIICCATSDRTPVRPSTFRGLDVKYVQTPLHRTQAVNEALKRCSGNLFGVLSPGDIYLSDAIERVLQEFRPSRGQQCFYSSTLVVGSNGKALDLLDVESDWTNRVVGHCRFSPQGVIYPKELVLKAGSLNETCKFWAEYDLWLRLDFGGCVFRYIPGPLAQRLASSETHLASDFSTPPTKDSLREMLQVRVLAGKGRLSWEHLAWYGATSASFESELQSNLFRRFISALKHVKDIRLSLQPQAGASVRDAACMLANLFHRLWRRSPLQEFGLPSPSPPSAIQLFFSNKLFLLKHHQPRALLLPRRYGRKAAFSPTPPTISLVTPSFNHGRHIESTMLSVLGQAYPALEYIVQDGGSTDETVSILRAHTSSLTFWETAPDGGQASAINRGFARTSGEIMAYLNSDDLLLPGSLAYVARFFEKNPGIDVVYGHRILIDADGHEIGRCVLPEHDNEAIAYADFIPQETLFWRRSAWETVGGRIDESYQFAMDYDLILRFRDAGLKFRRLPRFLGAFRVWTPQKTQAEWLSRGLVETRRLMLRTLGEVVTNPERNTPLQGYIKRQWWLDKLYSLGLLRF